MMQLISPDKRFDDDTNQKIANGELVAHDTYGNILVNPRLWTDYYRGKIYQSLGGYINGKFYSWPKCGCGAKLKLIVTVKT
jgi:hypothetical protein